MQGDQSNTATPPHPTNRDDAPGIFSSSRPTRQPTAAEAGWISGELETLGYRGYGLAFVSRCVIATTEGAAEAGDRQLSTPRAASVLSKLLRGAFAAVPMLQTLLLASAGAPPAHLLAGRLAAAAPLFAPVSAGEGPGAGVALRACARQQLAPPLSVRRARVQDHDELLPLLQSAARRHPSLAQLPDSCRTDEPFALTRLISSQDAGNAVLVAQLRGGGGGGGDRLVGLLVATCDVDVPLLHAAFDLAPYDGFLDPKLFEQLEGAARAQAAAERAAAGHDGSSAGGADEEAAGYEDGAPAAAGGAEGGEAAAGSATEGEAERVREILSDMVQRVLSGGGGPPGRLRLQQDQPHHRLLAVTMLCIEEEWEVQVPELLWAAFDAFPGKVRARVCPFVWAPKLLALTRSSATHAPSTPPHDQTGLCGLDPPARRAGAAPRPPDDPFDPGGRPRLGGRRQLPRCHPRRPQGGRPNRL
jgi:hypothetical protein